MKYPRVEEVCAVLRRLAPEDLAEDWDNVGLQLGDPDRRVARIGVALEVTSDLVDRGCGDDLDMLVTHHPLIFSPLRAVVPKDRVGRLIYDLLSRRTAVYAAHTNLDKSGLGPSARMARRLGLEDSVPIIPERDLMKLTVFVPADSLPRLRRALGDAGAGAIGDYSHCTFAASGQGTFRPSSTSNPYLGERGEINSVDEFRLETVAPRRMLGDLIEIILREHPYEEPAYDVHALDIPANVGLGRLGQMSQTHKLNDLAANLANMAGINSLRIIGDEDRRVREVAISSGAGSGIWESAMSKGADVLITGDVSYHAAEDMAAAGLAVIDMGHAGSEAPFLDDFAAALRDGLEEAGYDCELIELEPIIDPWTSIHI
ncbi:MAG: Nif3-like dinuclear metal center hexameric protein [Bacillota bacterium]